MYSNCCCSCSSEPEIIKIGQSSHKMYSNNILNFQEFATILNVCTIKSGNLLKASRTLGMLLQSSLNGIPLSLVRLVRVTTSLIFSSKFLNLKKFVL